MSTCDNWEEAILQTITNEDGSRGVRWVSAPDRIHVTEDVLCFDRESNLALMAEGYKVQEACPRLFGVRHARKARA